VTYLLHGTTLALAWFLALNAALSFGVIALARFARRSDALLTLRLLPAALSILFVAIVFIPSYWKFEPREFVEGFDLTLTLVAAAAAVVLARALARGAASWWRAAARTRAWTRIAEPIAFDIGIPAFRVDAPQPVLALVGIVRSRLIVTRGLVEALTPEELAASIAHELGHHRAWDNLKRLAMGAAPDVLGWTPAAHRLESAWAAAAEHAADAGESIASNRAARLALASALVKVARLMPPPAPIAEPISTLVGGGEIAARVHCLIDDAAPRHSAPRSPLARRAALAAAAAASLALVYAPLLATVHRATEVLVNRLP